MKNMSFINVGNVGKTHCDRAESKERRHAYEAEPENELVPSIQRFILSSSER